MIPNKKIYKCGLISLRNLTLILVLLGLSQVSFSQDEGPYRTRVSLEIEQFFDNTALLSAKLRVRIGKSYTSLKEKEVKFFNIAEDEKNIGIGTTDKDGLVSMIVEDIGKLNKGEDGYYTVSAVFDGDDINKASDDEVYFKNAAIEVNAVEEDSIKMLYIKAFEKDSMNPLVEQEITVQIPRLFNNLVIAEEETDEEGMVEIEFPNNIQINDGNEVNIFVKAIETDDFGTISTSIKKPWAKNNVKEAHLAERGLWSPDAPIWMVITFAILMLLTWGHYIIICYKLYLIKKEGNQKELA